MNGNEEEENLSLAEFIRLPTTVDFNGLNTSQFLQYAAGRPYIKLGAELATGFIPAYTNKENIEQIFRDLGSDFIGFFPKPLSPLGKESNDGAGITEVLIHPYLGLSGKGVIIGIVDSGIDYTKHVFKNEDGTSKIISIWDQTLDGPRRDFLEYGAEYNREDIDRALLSEDPYSIVPTRDTSGHGTFLSSVAAGSSTEEHVGAAPDAELMIVKLRPLNPYYIKKYHLPAELENVYSTVDFIMGANYIFKRAEELNMPVVLCVGLGTNLTGHDGNTPAEDFLSLMAQRIGVASVTAGGNESNAKHHTQGRILKTGAIDVISILVGEETSFTLSIFGPSFDRISIGVTSPSGEVISRLPFKVGLELTTELTIDRTIVSIGYYKDDNTVIIVGFQGAKEGIWEVTLYGDNIVGGVYHAWLPITNQVSPLVNCMRPVPEYTIVSPACALRTITCGAFNSSNNTLWGSSSWGPTRLPRMTPDFVAPGVNVTGVYPSGPGRMTGTSTAAATAAGAAAILLEWGIVQNNWSSMDGDTVRLLLINGCKRDEGILYPNTRWGFGQLNLYGTFFKIKETGIFYNTLGGL